MVILDNSRTLGAFERQSRILHILFIIFIFASEKEINNYLKYPNHGNKKK